MKWTSTRIDGAEKGVDWALAERALSMMGLKGYVTNFDTTTVAGADVVQAYQDLYQVERSFRMTKSDLSRRPIFSTCPRQFFRVRPSTVVMAIQYECVCDGARIRRAFERG